MGGSGGSGGVFSGRHSPAELRKQVQEAQDRTKDERFETEISNLINESLAQMNSRDTKAVQTHLDEIIKALGKETEGQLGLLFGGSIAKRTYVDGLSDVDALVILNKSELKDMKPEEVRSYFAERLRDSFDRTTVEAGTLAVTVSFGDVVVQLLPAIRDGSGIRIAAADGSGWSPVIRPDKFAEKLTQVNQQLNGKLVPTIKLAKSILSQLPVQQHLTGYHVESLAIEVFKKYSGEQTTKSMLREFFTQAPNVLRQPIKDSTGQSVHVDDYLGVAASTQRRMVFDSVGRIGRSIQQADRTTSVPQWKEILGNL